MTKAKIWTDGSCIGNPGKGGYAYCIEFQCGRAFFRSFASLEETTNNRMEIRAVIAGLSHAKRREMTSAVIYTDSTYVKDGITKWIDNWKNGGWKTSDKKPVKNQDLWKELDETRQGIEVDWKWTRAHLQEGDLGYSMENDLVDQMAYAASTAAERKPVRDKC